ncbi:MAG: GH3 auxin-responsive promoter family protein [Saprospiraceae bacterium]
MGFRSFLIRPFANLVSRDIARWSARAVDCQESIFRELVRKGAQTTFGRDHGLADVRTHADFARAVPVRDYEGLRPYVDQIKTGASDVLWPGKPKYFAKTSGTTSGVKYIPLTRDSMPNHFNTARNALFHYATQTGNYGFFDGKLIFLSGSPEMEQVGGIPTGRLSGIVNHEIPSWLRTNQRPTYATNCIEDWETKLDRIVDETLQEDMRLISGIPPWVQMYYERLLDRSGRSTIRELFPQYSIFVYGGVNFSPYRAKLEELTGGPMDSVETYPASEGFIAFQDVPGDPGLLLNANSGIFFEFVPLQEIHEEHPRRLTLGEVTTGVDYVLIINSNAGLWGYNIGDTVEFVSTDPYRLRVSGRVKHYISAFGEHVIGKEVEAAMQEVTEQFGLQTVEFTVAPQVNPPEGGLPYHEWLIEFASLPADLPAVAKALDLAMIRQNIYYEDLIKGQILRPLVITPLQQDAFRTYMKSEGKLGGQNKVPRLSNDRKLADALYTSRRF